MSGLVQPVSPLGRTPAAIVNGYSSGGVLSGGTTGAFNPIAQKILSGALTAGVAKPLLSIAGAGLLELCGSAAQDATVRAVTLIVIADGVTMFYSSTPAVAQSDKGIWAVGGMGTGGTPFPVGQLPIPFASSLVVQLISSLTETDKNAIHVIYRVF